MMFLQNCLSRLLVFVILLGTTGANAQKAKVEGVQVPMWKIPKKIVPNSYTTFSVNTIKTPQEIESYVNNKLELHPVNGNKKYKNKITQSKLELLRLQQFYNVKTGGDIILDVVENSIRLELKTTEKKDKIRKEEPPTYQAKIKSTASIVLDIKDREGKLIHTIREKYENTIVENDRKVKANLQLKSRFKNLWTMSITSVRPVTSRICLNPCTKFRG